MCSRMEQLVQHTARLPNLPGVYGHDDPCLLTRQLEGPAEGPHEGGGAHLHDVPHVQVRTINDDERASTAAEGDDSRGPRRRRAEAAGGGQVKRRPGRMCSRHPMAPLAGLPDQSVE